MIRRALGLGGVALAALGVVGAVEAAAPDGPRLAFVRVVEKPLALELVTSDSAASRVEKVVRRGLRKRPLPSPFGVPAWSPDGSLIAFSGWPRRLGPGRRSTQIYLVRPDGSGLTEISGSKGGVGPVFSPDGQTVAFAKTAVKLLPLRLWKGATMWSVGIGGLHVRQLTPWRDGVEDFPSSFSPDGSSLAFSHSRAWDSCPRAMALRLDGSGSFLLRRDAARPIYSPDGRHIAFLEVQGLSKPFCCVDGHSATFTESSTDLYAMNADGSGVRRLTDTPDAVELAPSWDPGGDRLVYSQLRDQFWKPGLSAFEGDLMQVNADGTCRTRILGSRESAPNSAAAWQPGPGREAGRIAC